MSNTAALQTELQNKQYDLMESQLDSVLAESIADPSYELVERDCANFAEGSSFFKPSDKGLIDAWVAARPNSPWAHYSEALRWSDDAWSARGSGFADSVKDSQLKSMHKDETSAREEMHKSLMLNPKIAMAWTMLIDIDRTDGGLEMVRQDYDLGSAQLPNSFLIPDQYMEALQPRWFGSYDMMDDFAKSMLTKLDNNPRFWALQGEMAADQGCAACNDYKWEISLKDYSTALVYEDRVSWLDRAGEAAEGAHRYALAYRFYERSLAYKPNNIHSYTRLKIMDVLCNPKASADEISVFKPSLEKYQRAPGDCIYYKVELPWDDEPIPYPGFIKPYDVQNESNLNVGRKKN